jgi:hypothetical protein
MTDQHGAVYTGIKGEGFFLGGPFSVCGLPRERLVAVTGRRDSHRSEWLFELLRRVLSHGSRVVVFCDPSDAFVNKYRGLCEIFQQAPTGADNLYVYSTRHVGEQMVVIDRIRPDLVVWDTFARTLGAKIEPMAISGLGHLSNALSMSGSAGLLMVETSASGKPDCHRCVLKGVSARYSLTFDENRGMMKVSLGSKGVFYRVDDLGLVYYQTPKRV